MRNKTELNVIANKILKKKYDELGINHCEIGQYFNYLEVFKNCWKVRQGYAHDKDRDEFNQDPEELFTVKHTLSACNHCHAIIDRDKKLRFLLFKQLRGTMKEPKTKLLDRTRQKFKSKKADWMVDHKCLSCKAIVSSLICPKCNRLSVKT